MAAFVSKGVVYTDSKQRFDETLPKPAKEPFSEQERKLLGLLRNTRYGEIRIVLRDSEIVQIEEKKSIKL